MSQLVSRILLAIFVFPLASIFYLVMFVVIEESGRSNGFGSYREREMVAFIACGAATWIGVAAYWWLLWRSSVRWTGTRIGGSVVAAALSAVAGTAIGFVVGFPLGPSSPWFFASSGLKVE